MRSRHQQHNGDMADCRWMLIRCWQYRSSACQIWSRWSTLSTENCSILRVSTLKLKRTGAPRYNNIRLDKCRPLSIAVQSMRLDVTPCGEDTERLCQFFIQLTHATSGVTRVTARCMQRRSPGAASSRSVVRPEMSRPTNVHVAVPNSKQNAVGDDFRE